MSQKAKSPHFVMSETELRPRRLARDIAKSVRASANLVLDARKPGLPPLPIPIDKNARSSTNATLRLMKVPSLNISTVDLKLNNVPRRSRSESDPSKPMLPLLPRKRRLSNADEPTKEFIDMAKKVFENRQRTYFEKKKENEIDPLEEFRITPLPPFPIEEDA